ncbi:MAG: hypothetical protein JXA30_11935 [Deltaproteobacteria bacterium]|nr:hypothetical protein [Deltaproteobacteria bacterium]
MYTNNLRLVIVLFSLLVFFVSCRSGKGTEETEPIVKIMELPVALRNKDPEPSSARKVEISFQELRVDGKTVLQLTEGKIPDSERSGLVAPKIESALDNPRRSHISVEAYSGVPFKTLLLTLGSAQSTGTRNASFRVREPGQTDKTGWLEIKNFKVLESTWEEITFDNVSSRPWTDFVNVWEDVAMACRRQKSVVFCKDMPTKISQRGRLQIILSTAGSAITLEFKQVGEPRPEEMELPEGQPPLEQVVVGEKDGVKMAAYKIPEGLQIVEGQEYIPEEFPIPDGLDDELTEEFLKIAPAREAGFQFRGGEALYLPSPVSETMAPVCGKIACGVVITGRPISPVFRMLSLIGGSFPDGSPFPAIAFMLPPI